MYSIFASAFSRSEYRQYVSIVCSLIFSLAFFLPWATHAFSSYSLIVSSHTPLVSTTYLLTFGLSRTLTGGDNITFTIDDAFIWPSDVQPEDIKLTVNNVQQSITITSSTTGYLLTNSTGNVITLTAPQNTTVAATSQIEILFGIRGTFYNPKQASTYPYTVALRNQNGDLLDIGSGVTLVQDTRVGLSAEPPSLSGGGASSVSEPTQETPTETPKVPSTPETTEDRKEIFEPIFLPTIDESVPVKPDRTDVDLTKDNVIDRKDAELFFEFHEMLPIPAFDFDLNGEVNTRDFSILLSQWSPDVAEPSSGGGWATVSVGPPLAQDHVVLHGVVDDHGSEAFVLASMRSLALREDVLTTYVLLDTGQTGVNAVDFEFFFDASILTFVRAVTDASIFSLWKQPPSASADGRIELVAGHPTAFTGTNGLIVALEFVKKVSFAPVQFSFSEEPDIYHPYGVRAQLAEAPAAAFVDLETFVEEMALQQKKEAGISKMIPPVTLSSSSHPEEGLWYSTRNIHANWLIDSKHQEGDHYLYTLSPTSVLADFLSWPTTSDLSVNLQAPSDGRWYMHVIRWRDGQYSEPSIFEILIDTLPPQPFLIEKGLFHSFDGKRNYLLSFGTTDLTSGMVWYDVTVNGRNLARSTQPREILLDMDSGVYVITVAAQDAAGNQQMERTILTVPFARKTKWFMILSVVLFGLVSLLFSLHKKHQK